MIIAGHVEAISHSEGHLEVPLARSPLGYTLLEYCSFRSGPNINEKLSYRLDSVSASHPARRGNPDVHAGHVKHGDPGNSAGSAPSDAIGVSALLLYSVRSVTVG